MRGDEAEAGVEGGDERLADVAGEQLGRGVGERKQAAVAGGKYPATIGECGGDFVARFGDANLRMLGGKQNEVIEVVRDLAKDVAESEEVDDQRIGVEWPGDFCRDVVVVAVEPLAVAGERDEVGGAEDVLHFGDANGEGFRHGGTRKIEPRRHEGHEVNQLL